jgi:hypothetical protein
MHEERVKSVTGKEKKTHPLSLFLFSALLISRSFLYYNGRTKEECCSYTPLLLLVIKGGVMMMMMMMSGVSCKK